MCGILGTVGNNRSQEFMQIGLVSLESRGRDSFGIVSSYGKELVSLHELGGLSDFGDVGDVGTTAIGHSRWGSVGGLTKENIHPFIINGLVGAMNGEVNNTSEISGMLNDEFKELIRGATDSELYFGLVAQMIQEDKLSLEEAISKVNRDVACGSFAILAFEQYNYGEMVGCVQGDRNSLKIAASEHGILSGSQASLFNNFGVQEYAEVTNGQTVTFSDSEMRFSGGQRNVYLFEGLRTASAELGSSPDYMHLEINQQPAVLRSLLARNVDGHTINIELPEEASRAKSIDVLSSGSSENAMRLAVSILAHQPGLHLPEIVMHKTEEFRRQAGLSSPEYLLVLSQSGETSDVRDCLKSLADRSSVTVQSIINTPNSPLHLDADSSIFLGAGAERAVAATKSYTAQVVLALLNSLKIASERGSDNAAVENMLDNLKRTPDIVTATLELFESDEIANAAEILSKAEFGSVIGSGPMRQLAEEISLKLTEVAQFRNIVRNSEEFKHGPISLVGNNSPVVTIYGSDKFYNSVLDSSVRNITSKGGQVIVIGPDSQAAKHETNELVSTLSTPECQGPVSQALSNAVVGQMLAYKVAINRGIDPVNSRHCAKAITV